MTSVEFDSPVRPHLTFKPLSAIVYVEQNSTFGGIARLRYELAIEDSLYDGDNRSMKDATWFMSISPPRHKIRADNPGDIGVLIPVSELPPHDIEFRVFVELQVLNELIAATKLGRLPSHIGITVDQMDYQESGRVIWEMKKNRYPRIYAISCGLPYIDRDDEYRGISRDMRTPVRAEDLANLQLSMVQSIGAIQHSLSGYLRWVIILLAVISVVLWFRK
jgi:hypothetical protein